jgi:hypothetical protein
MNREKSYEQRKKKQKRKREELLILRITLKSYFPTLTV